VIHDYPDGPLWRRVERQEARDEAIQERADELQADHSAAGYWPWHPKNLSEALSEMPEPDLSAVAILLATGTTADDAAAGLLIRRHCERYWQRLATWAAEREIDRETARAREDFT